MENKHTKGLWKVDGSGIGIYHSNPDGFGAMLAGTGMPDVSLPECQANARRIVACVNACAGVPTDALERSQSLDEFMRSMTAIEQQRDELLAALELSEGNISSLAASHPVVWTNWLEVVRAAMAKVKGGAS